ncbi:hypothetical protein ABK040_007707 [Willaertia magna]
MQKQTLLLALSFILSLFTSVFAATSKGIVQVQVISRHCDRTPWVKGYDIPKDPINWYSYLGLSEGQLTGLGQRQCFQMGEIIRNKYIVDSSSSKIIGIDTHYNQTHYYFRSTDVDRTLMSIWSASMGLFPHNGAKALDPNQNGINSFSLPNGTQALPIHTVSEVKDSLLLGFQLCNTVIRRYENVKTSIPYVNFFTKNRDFIDRLYAETGWTNGDDSIGVLFDLLTVQISHQLLSIQWVLENWNQIDSMRNDYLILFYNYKVCGKEGMSVLIQTLIENMQSLQKKYIHYSAHDTTLQFLAAGLMLTEDYPYLGGQPPYGTNMAFELHQMSDGSKSIRVVYNHGFNDTSFTPLVLKSLGCADEFCPLNSFISGTNSNSITKDWCLACDNSDNTVCADEFLKQKDSLGVAFVISTPILAFTNVVTLLIAIVACVKLRYFQKNYEETEYLRQ